ncbi:MAG: leucine-rich repeat protein [Clostridiales bacterium]|nr:leucine-rich repeat protein [Clostridiales bacterium]
MAIALPVSCVQPKLPEVFFSVTFIMDDEEKFVSVKEGEAIDMSPMPTNMDGREFLYWATEDGKEYDLASPVTSDITLHAVWKKEAEVIYHTVKFYDTTGQLIKTEQVIEGASARGPVVTTTDFFVFDGWDKDISSITEDMEVYAKEKYDSVDVELLDFAINRDGTYFIKGVRSGASLPQMAGGYIKLALPTEYKGAKVTGIADGSNYKGAFSCMNILSIYIPSTYKKIGAYAFYGNPALMNVTFNEGLTHIGEGAFMARFDESYTLNGNYANSGANVYVSALTKVKLPSTIESIGAYAFNHIGWYFENGNYVAKRVDVSFGSKIKTIGSHAFEGVMIDTLDLSMITERLMIGDYAFAADTYLNWVQIGSYDYPCSRTTRLSLPNTVSRIGDYAFYGLGNYSTYYNGKCSTIAYHVQYDASRLNIDYIGAYSFYNAKLMGTLSLITKIIRERAFYGQTFSYITIGIVEDIGAYAFGRDGGEVSSVVELGYDLKTLGEGAFINNVGLKTITLPNTLTRIGARAFEGCTSLSGSLTFPATLTKVGSYAFRRCGLQYIDIKGSVKLASNCFENSALKEISGNIKSVDSAAFSGCVNLLKLTLPADLNELPDNLFYNCQSLKNVTLPKSLNRIGSNAFYGCTWLESITLPSNIAVIDSSSFEGCSLLSNVIFEGDGLEKINSNAFAYCPKLSSIDLPDSVTTIDDYAFQGSGLTSFRTPASLNSLGYRVFYQREYNKVKLPALKTITINREANPIDFGNQGAFDGSEITAFEVEDGNSYYTSKDGALYNSDGTVLIMFIRSGSASSINLPEGVVRIASGAFRDNTYLYNITLPHSLKIIDAYAFYNCSRLQSVTFSEGLEQIGEYAFGYNKMLRSIKLPSSLERIEREAFYSATGLTNIDFSIATALNYIGYRAFSGDPGLVPKMERLDFTGAKSLAETGVNAFSGTSLKSIDFGDIQVISVGSFSECNSLVDVTIGHAVSEIGSSAFLSCTSLKNIIIPTENSLRRIMSYTFAGTITQKVNYTSLDLSNAVHLELIGDCAFAYGNVSSVVLPDAPVTLGDEVFSSCSLLSDVDFGNGLVAIGENIFRYCIALRELNLPTSLLTIGKDAFRELNLIKVNIGTPYGGNSIEMVGKYAFFDCKSLSEVNVYGDNIPMLTDLSYNLSFHSSDGHNNVSVLSGLTIYVDYGKKDEFLSSTKGWGIYKDLIGERSRLVPFDEENSN